MESNNCCPVTKLVKSLGNGEMHYHAEIVPLDIVHNATAGDPNGQVFPLSGNRLLVEVATGSASIVFNDRGNAQIPLLAGLQIKGNFDRFWIVNDAQEYAKLVLIVSTNLEASLNIPPEPTFATVTYEPNGGIEPSFYDFARQGRPYALASGGFTQAGKSLIGWNTEAFSTMSGWTVTGTGITNPNSIFPDINNNIVIVGTNGTILTSSDNGATWGNLSDSSLGNLYNGFQANGISIITTESATLLISSNSFNSWTSTQLEITGNSLYGGISIGNLIIVYGQGGLIYRSIDNAATWMKASTTFYGNLMTGVNANSVILLGGNGAIMRSIDNGESWLQVYSGATFITTLCYINDNLILAGGNGGVLLQSLDRGASWNAITSPVLSAFTIRGIFKLNNMLVIVDSSGTVNTSIDNGSTWSNESCGIANIAYSNLVNNQLMILNNTGNIATSALASTSYALGQSFNPYLIGDLKLFAVWS